MTLPLTVYIALGGALGASARHWCGQLVTRIAGHGFPWSTLTVNVVGSFLMGLLVVWLARREVGTPQDIRAFLAVGLLGGFTTFSTFSLDAVTLIERQAWGAAVGYMLSSVIASVVALMLGFWVMRGVAA